MSLELLTAVLFGVMLILLMAGLPVVYCLGGTGIIFILFLWGPAGLIGVPLAVMGEMRTFVLIAIPMFVFMAMVLERCGIADALYDMMYKWLAGLRGGLAIGTVLICTLFAAMAGISAAATVTMGLIALPSMLKRGYNKNIAMGSIAAGGALGVLIPPSVLMIIYALFANESVGRMFAGGVLPGIMLSGLFCLYIFVRATLQPSIAPMVPKAERATWPEKLVSLKSVILPIFLVIGVLGSIFFGIATPTESAAVGAAGAVICAIINRRFGWKSLTQAATQTLSVTAMIIWIIVGATIFTSIYNAVGARDLIQRIMLGLHVAPIMVLIIIQLIWFVLGCFLDPTGIVMITAPIFVPVIKALGMDPVWFGVIFVVNMEMAFLTPPYGVNLFYLKGIVPKGITMADIYRSILPFVGIQALGLVLVILFPPIITWLPGLVFAR